MVRPSPGFRRPAFELLEDRTVPSTLQVSNLLDDGSAGSLRQEVTAARPGDAIVFAPGLFASGPGTLTLNGSELRLSKDLTISGPGASLLSIDGHAASRVFEVDAGV